MCAGRPPRVTARLPRLPVDPTAPVRRAATAWLRRLSQLRRVQHLEPSVCYPNRGPVPLWMLAGHSVP